VEQIVSLNLAAATNEHVLIGNMTSFRLEDGQGLSEERNWSKTTFRVNVMGQYVSVFLNYAITDLVAKSANTLITTIRACGDRLYGLVVRVPGYRAEMYCAFCEVRTEFIYAM
jgi:hypothetical protein